MTQFKQALLDELVAHAQRSAHSVRTGPRHGRRAVRVASIAAAGLVATFVTVLVAPNGEGAAYAVETNPDGTVSITFRELGNAEAATRDLRAAGVRAQVLRLAQPGSCATSTGGVPWDPQPGNAYHISWPALYPIEDHTKVTPRWSENSMTIRPDLIPPDAVLLIIESSSGTSGVMLSSALVNDPAPTCWEPVSAMPRVQRSR